MSRFYTFFFVGLILAMAALAFGWLARLRASSKWMAGSGRVVRSELKLGHSTQLYRGQIDAGATYYHACVEYRYTVADKIYLGKNLMATGPGIFRSQAEAMEVLNQYPLNQEVTVYYEPAHPDQACLIKGSAIPVSGYWLLGILIIGITGIIIAVWLAMDGNYIDSFIRRIRPRHD